jgi:glycosyltransferase involved in cell wall biosynthesis
MAAGLPILATDIPGHRDMLQHRTTGWLAATRSDLVEGLTWLEDPLHNVAIGQAARQQIKDTVGTWDDCADRYAAAYRDLLAPEPSA